MYSILKTQKRSVQHKKTVSITSSLFLTNNHVVLTFSNCACVVYSLYLSSSQPQVTIWEDSTSSLIIDSRRLCQGRGVLLGKQASNVYILQLNQNKIQHTIEVGLIQMNRSIFAQMVSNPENALLANSLGCQLKLHGFVNNCFIIQYFIYQDRKILLDCYKYREIINKSGQHFYKSEAAWDLDTIQVDIQINGHFVIQSINLNTGQLALYKQQQIVDSDWILRVFSPFVDQKYLNPQQQSPCKQVRIVLPSHIFDDNTMIVQICQYINDGFMIIVSNKANSKLRAYVLYGVSQSTVGHHSQNSFNFQTITQSNSHFLIQGFIRMVYVNPKDQIFYAITHTHQRVDGELYENGLIIGNLKNGNLIEKGYCTLKNIDFSPNYRYILDMPYEYENYGQTFYHIRILLSKSSLYMFLIQNNKSLTQFSQAFKQAVVGFL